MLDRPLEYLHPQRLRLPASLDLPAVRDILDPLLLRSLGLDRMADAQPFEGAWQRQWLLHWRRLPYVASLMGASLLIGDLARGGRLRELDASHRTFAAFALGDRACVTWPDTVPVPQRLDALGLQVLLGWHGRVSAGLLERLALQFSPYVVELAATLPAQPMRTSLFTLAVQHARRYPKPA